MATGFHPVDDALDKSVRAATVWLRPDASASPTHLTVGHMTVTSHHIASPVSPRSAAAHLLGRKKVDGIPKVSSVPDRLCTSAVNPALDDSEPRPTSKHSATLSSKSFIASFFRSKDADVNGDGDGSAYLTRRQQLAKKSSKLFSAITKSFRRGAVVASPAAASGSAVHPTPAPAGGVRSPHHNVALDDSLDPLAIGITAQVWECESLYREASVRGGSRNRRDHGGDRSARGTDRDRSIRGTRDNMRSPDYSARGSAPASRLAMTQGAMRPNGNGPVHEEGSWTVRLHMLTLTISCRNHLLRLTLTCH